jgi:hypothetical protein
MSGARAGGISLYPPAWDGSSAKIAGHMSRNPEIFV